MCCLRDAEFVLLCCLQVYCVTAVEPCTQPVCQACYLKQPVLPCAVGLDTQGIAGSSVALKHEQGVGMLLDAALKSPMSDKELTAITTLEREVRICYVIYAFVTSTLLCQHVMSVTAIAHIPRLICWVDVLLARC